MESIEFNIKSREDEIIDLNKNAQIYLDKIPNAELKKKIWEKAKEYE